MVGVLGQELAVFPATTDSDIPLDSFVLSSFIVNLTHARGIQEEGTSIKKIPL